MPSTLLVTNAPWPAQIDGARLLECSSDPALLPTAIRALAQSKLGQLRNDPDVYERIARTIASQPAGAVAAAFRELPADELVSWSGHSLCHQWLNPVSGETFDCDNWTPTLPLSTVRGAVDRWLDELAGDPQGFGSILNDQGNRFWFLLEDLQGELLATLVQQGSIEDGLLVADVSRMLLGRHESVVAALVGRAENSDDSRWKEAVRTAGAIQDRAERSQATPDKVFRPWPVEVPPATRDFVRRPPESSGPGLGVAPVGSVLGFGLIVVCLLGARNSERRSRWFATGAVCSGLTMVFAVEWGLVLAGLPTPVTEPAQQSSDDVLESVSIDGTQYLTTTASAGRYQIFEERRPEGSCRIVTLGGSAVHGSFYLVEEAFSAVLERRLRDGGNQAEVLNLGVGGATSEEVRSAAAGALRAGADILVLYLGSNDLEHLPLLADLRGSSAERIASQTLLEQSRIMRFLRSALRAPEGMELVSVPDGRPLLDENPLEGPRLEALLDVAAGQVVRNIRWVIEQAETSGVQVVVGTQLINEEFCPPGEDAKKPRSCFSERLRAISERAVAGTGATLVDVPAALRQHGGGPAGHLYFRDYVHPSQLGHAVIGEALAPSVERLCASPGLGEPGAE